MLLVTLPSPPSSALSGVCICVGCVGARCCLLCGVGGGGPQLGTGWGGTRRSSAPFSGVAAFCYLPGKITARVRLSSRSVLPVGGGGVRDIFIFFFCFPPCFPIVALSSSDVVQMPCMWGFSPPPSYLPLSFFASVKEAGEGFDVLHFNQNVIFLLFLPFFFLKPVQIIVFPACSFILFTHTHTRTQKTAV